MLTLFSPKSFFNKSKGTFRRKDKETAAARFRKPEGKWLDGD